MKRALKATIAVLAIALLLPACSTVPLDSIPAGEMVSVDRAPNNGVPTTLDVSNANLGRATAKGSGGGAVAGALSAIACGPYIAFCMPFTTLLGAGTGALLGSAVGAAQALPTPTYEEVRDKAKSGSGEQDIGELLMQSVRERLGQRWVVVPSQGTSHVRVSLDRAALAVDRDQRVAVSMRATVTVYRGDRPHQQPQVRTYNYTGAAHEPAAWIEDRDGLIARSVNGACWHISQSIYAELAR